MILVYKIEKGVLSFKVCLLATYKSPEKT